MNYASHPIASYLFNDTTIAASSKGTAAATSLVASMAVVHASYMRVHNMSLVPIEIIFGAERDTTAVGVFIPGMLSATASSVVPMEFPIALDQGIAIRARTVQTVAATFGSTTPLHISLWD